MRGPFLLEAPNRLAEQPETVFVVVFVQKQVLLLLFN